MCHVPDPNKREVVWEAIGLLSAAGYWMLIVTTEPEPVLPLVTLYLVAIVGGLNSLTWWWRALREWVHRNG